LKLDGNILGTQPLLNHIVVVLDINVSAIDEDW
jgi:hypothetical protein